jgi:hypothetical protein
MTCETCEGTGKVWTSRWGGNDPDVWPIPCPECGTEDPDRLRDQRIDDRLLEQERQQ